MYFLLVIIAAVFAGLSAALPSNATTTIPAKPPYGTWTIYDLERRTHHHNKLCKWAFRIKDTNDLSIDCHFRVKVPKFHDCREEGFGLKPCSEEDGIYFATGAPDRDGFFVVKVENLAMNTEATFQFLNTAIDDRKHNVPPQEAPVSHRIETRPPAPTPTAPIGLPPPSETSSPSPVKRDLGVNASEPTVIIWTVRDVIRRVNEKRGTLEMNFAILSSDPDWVPTSCSISIINPPEGITDLAKLSWYDKRCEDSGFYVSWGYVEARDAAIMTLVSPTRDVQAFFGFPNISSSESLQPEGPGAVVHCDCGKAPQGRARGVE